MNDEDVSEDQLYQTAMAILARREHSRQELRQKLLRKHGLQGSLEAVLDRLEAERYLSDQRFAEVLARSRARRGYGPVRVRAELAAKGVRGEMATASIAVQEEDWVTRARDALERKFGTQPAADANEKAKRYRFLAQRGFSGDQIRRAMTADSED